MSSPSLVVALSNLALVAWFGACAQDPQVQARPEPRDADSDTSSALPAPPETTAATASTAATFSAEATEAADAADATSGPTIPPDTAEPDAVWDSVASPDTRAEDEGVTAPDDADRTPTPDRDDPTDAATDASTSTVPDVRDTTANDLTEAAETQPPDPVEVTVPSSCDHTAFAPNFYALQPLTPTPGADGLSVKLVRETPDWKGESVVIAFRPPRDWHTMALPFDGPGDYPIGATPEDRDSRTCTTCVIAQTDCDFYTAITSLGFNRCAHTFFATSGILHLDALDLRDETARGSLLDVTFEPAAIVGGEDEWGDVEVWTTPLSEGQPWCIERSDFDFDAGTECHAWSDCHDPARPVCLYQQCVACSEDLQCPAARPVCVDSVCVAGADCSDPADADEPNDGPAEATPIAPGTPVTGRICPHTGTQGQREQDVYTFELTAFRNLDVALAEATDADDRLHMYRVDGPSWAQLGEWQWSFSASTPQASHGTIAGAPPGRYYLVVASSAIDLPHNPFVSESRLTHAYQLTVTATAVECVDGADCHSGARPYCDEKHVCQACLTSLDCGGATPVCALGSDARHTACMAPSHCAQDDAREDADDGPWGATPLHVGDIVTGTICVSSAVPERDLFVIELTNAQRHSRVTVNLTEASDYYDNAWLTLYDEQLHKVDISSYWSSGTEIVMTGVPAGRYYLAVGAADPVSYTLTYQ